MAANAAKSEIVAYANTIQYIVTIVAISVVFICTILTLHLVYKLSFDIEIMHRTERACEPERAFVRDDQRAPSWYAKYHDPYRSVIDSIDTIRHIAV
jgi:hypothetical protein